MIEVLNFTINKNNGSYRTDKYRIVKEYKGGIERYRIQYETPINGFLTYVNESDEYWVSLDHVLASARFQNLFK